MTLVRRILVDPSTGQSYEVEMDDANGGGPVPHDGGGSGSSVPGDAAQYFNRTPGVSDKQLDVMLTETAKPKPIQNVFWALNHKLALLKVTDPMEYYRFKMRVENVIRAYHLQSREPGEDVDIMEEEMLEFDATSDLSRSIVYDDRPNEREQWTPVMVRQSITQGDQSSPMATGGTTSLLGGVVSKIFGRRR